MTKETTVRVRILVAVDEDGKWVACGSSEHEHREVYREVILSLRSLQAKEIIYIDDLRGGEIYHWVEADVPLPAEAGPAIEGTVHAE